MPSNKTWLHDSLRNPFDNCPTHHQLEVNFVSWRLQISEIDLTNDDTESVLNIDGRTLPIFSGLFL